MSSPEDLRQATLSGFTVASIGLNGWVSSVGAEGDTLSVLSAIQDGRDLHPLTPATTEERYHTASMRIMHSLCRALNSGQGEEPVIWKEIDGVDDLYSRATDVLDAISLDFNLSAKLDPMLRVVGSCVEGWTASGPHEQAAKETWYARGTVMEKQLLLRDMNEALEHESDPETRLEAISTTASGAQTTVSSFPTVPSRPVEIHFYRQYISGTRGAHEYLEAYFEDIVSLNEKITTA